MAIPLLCGGYGQEASKGVRFTDVTLQAGIRFKHVNSASGRMYYVETAGAGCAFLDYNNDGKLDIYLVNGATLPGFKPERPITGALYRNNGDGTFMDVTAQVGGRDRWEPLRLWDAILGVVPENEGVLGARPAQCLEQVGYIQGIGVGDEQGVEVRRPVRQGLGDF